jgi:hypothetical protein
MLITLDSHRWACDQLGLFDRMNLYLAAFLMLMGTSTIVGGATASDEVPLKFERLDLTDGRKLKNVVVKTYDAKTQRLLVIADGKAMMVPIASLPPPFNERLKSAPAAGGSVNTITPPLPRSMSSAADQYYLERAVPMQQPHVVYVPQPAPVVRPAPVDPMLAQATLKGHQDAARARASRYFRYVHQMGSNSIIVQSVSLELTVPATVPGWTGRFQTAGTAYIEYFDSKGRSFQRATSTFEVTTEQKPGEALQVVDFTRKT